MPSLEEYRVHSCKCHFRPVVISFLVDLFDDPVVFCSKFQSDYDGDDDSNDAEDQGENKERFHPLPGAVYGEGSSDDINQ